MSKFNVRVLYPNCDIQEFENVSEIDYNLDGTIILKLENTKQKETITLCPGYFILGIHEAKDK